ncbi:MAG: hypothetical protein ACW99A_02050 [Candidatus Kariarchaeaceae archaeon]|jgi:hypothetical protein
MGRKKTFSDKELRSFATNSFNQTWEYIEKENRSELDDEMMVHCAHTSRFYWGFVGTPINFQRGDWMLAKVYLLANRGHEAMHYAKSCLKLTEVNDFKDFDLAYANEIMARASAAVGNKDDVEKYYQLAFEAGETIEKTDNKKMFMDDLEAAPWFGFR